MTATAPRTTSSTLNAFDKRPASAALAMIAIVAVSASCSEYVAYDEDFVLPGGETTSLEGLSVTRMDHLLFRGFMSRFLERSKDLEYVLMDYDGVRESDEARFSLDQYLALLAAVDPSKLQGKSERLAYWINAYNAAVIKGVLTRYGGDATYKVTTSGSFFDDPLFTLGGQRMTLNYIEQGVLRGKLDHASVSAASAAVRTKLSTWHKELWGGGAVDPRFHAAVNCAAVSCPNLLDAAPFVFQPALLDSQLDSVTRAWLDSPKKGAGPQGISKLFDWYAEDFIASSGSVDAFIAAYRKGGLTGVDTSRSLTYDWTLNIKGVR